MYLYVVMSANGLFKIGKSEKPAERFAQLKSASPINVSMLLSCEYDEWLEKKEEIYHKKFAHLRVRGEWFALQKAELSWIISNLTDGNYDKELDKLMTEMEDWGFFQLGEIQLYHNKTMACLYRAESLELMQSIARGEAKVEN